MKKNISSGFNYRLIAGTNRPSSHSFGKAIDINPVQNPYIRYTAEEIIAKPVGAVWNPKEQGTLSASHHFVQFLKQLGWEWGGDWA